jgi:hypothetical protein
MTTNSKHVFAQVTGSIQRCVYCNLELNMNGTQLYWLATGTCTETKAAKVSA